MSNMDQKKIMDSWEETKRKHNLGDWKVIEIATDSLESSEKLKALNFKESPNNMKEGHYDLFFCTKDTELWRNRQHQIRDQKIDYIGISTSPFATDDYVIYLESILDPRD